MFFCHQQDGRLCAGWVGCHDMEESFGIRIGLLQGLLTEDDYDAIIEYESPVPLFASGRETAEHGLAHVETPSPEAVRTIQRLSRKIGDRRG